MERKDFGRNGIPRRALMGEVLLISLISSLFLISFLVSPANAREKGVDHVVTQGVTLYRISRAYKVPIARLMEANGLSSPSALKVGSKIFVPGAKAVVRVEPFIPLSAREKNDLERTLGAEKKPIPAEPGPGIGKQGLPSPGKELDLIWPIQGKINSPFGARGKNFHRGIDIASPSYQEVKAAMDGEVILARNSRNGYGNVIVVRHDAGLSTIYGHMNVIIAKEGEAVRQGQAIGGVGSTGKSTGPHLHFELRREGRPLDPLPLLPMTIEELLEKASKR
jgi:lipoprotein NlpD